MLRAPLVFAYNILESKFSLFGLHLHEHIKDLFQSQGVKCHLLPIRNGNTSTFKSRTKQIQNFVSRVGKCHLVGYSTAGIDCSLCPFSSPEILSVTTISTPHQGSLLANWANSRYYNFQHLSPVLSFLGLSLAAFRQFTPQSISSLPKQPAVNLYSISSWRDPENVCDTLKPTAKVLKKIGTYSQSFNDGVFTAQECEGGFHLISYDADHAELIGSNLQNSPETLYRLIVDNLKFRYNQWVGVIVKRNS